MKKISLLLLIASFFIIISCEKEKNEPENKQTYKYNNSSILVGEEIGDNSENLGNIWKTGSVVIENDKDEFYIDTVYFARKYSTSDFVHWIIPVKNISGNSHAFIEAVGIEFLDINNQIINEDILGYSYVTGSSCVSDILMTNTFLRTDESGYFLGSDEVNFDQVAKIKLESIQYYDSDFIYSDINVIPTSYQTSGNKMNVDIKNESDETVYITSSNYILLDEVNRPLGWGFLDPKGFENLLPNSTGTLNDIFFRPYKGLCTKIQAVIDFDYESVDSKSAILKNSSLELSHEEFHKQTSIRRNKRLKQQSRAQKRKD